MPNRTNRSTATAATPPPELPGRRQGRRQGRLSTRSQLVRRVLLALLLGLSLLLLDRSGLLERWLGQIAPARLDWANDYPLVEYLRGMVVDTGLTRDRKDCLLFIINGNDPPDASRFEVMEKHSGTCPGPRGTLPKLFTLRIDRIHHRIETDAGTPGAFHPLP